MIVFFHLLNDRSGSPRVLRNTMSALAGRDPQQVLYVGQGGDGFLSGAAPEVRRFPYRRGQNKLATLCSYLWSQASLLGQLWSARDIRRNATCYVNTALPFAGALFGKLSGRRVVYHLHEVSIHPAPLRWFLLAVVRWTASQVICVSEFHRVALGLARAQVVPNAIDAQMYERAMRSTYEPRRQGVFNVSMLCALRDYKGVPELVQLARHFEKRDESIRFQLVTSDSEEEVRRYFSAQPLPSNLRVVLGLSDTATIYEQAGLVLNLSKVDVCQETFGLTLLEAMSFGVPVIAPPVGGPAELVDDGVQGYLVDSRNADLLQSVVERLAGDEAECRKLSRAAREKARSLSPEKFQNAINDAVWGASR